MGQSFGFSCHLQPFCSSACLPQAGQNEERGDASGHIQIPVLGKVFGCLILMSFEEEKTNCVALGALYALLNSICQQKVKRSYGGLHPSAQ